MLYTCAMSADAVSAVLALAEQWRAKVSSDLAHRIVAYLGLLLKWNERVNLTGAQSLGELISDHLPDSFVLAGLCPMGASVVDVGSGGGLPALPLAILRTDCRIGLIEPRAKRVAFLRTAVREVGCVGVEVFHGRLDDFPGAGFGVAVSRATFGPEAWLPMARPLLASGGIAVVLAAARIHARAPAVQLMEEREYVTGNGAPRWCGSFCYT